MNEQPAHSRGRAHRQQRELVFWDRDDLPAPEGWSDVFGEMTNGSSAGQWGRRAALSVAQARFETGTGPTFSELFHVLLPDTAGLPTPLPEEFTYLDRRYAINRFRYGCGIAWADLGWIRWRRGIERSLDTGPRIPRSSD